MLHDQGTKDTKKHKAIKTGYYEGAADAAPFLYSSRHAPGLIRNRRRLALRPLATLAQQTVTTNNRAASIQACAVLGPLTLFHIFAYSPTRLSGVWSTNCTS